MLLAPRPTSTASQLLRLVAVWLAVILLFEGFAVAQSRAAGPVHQHQGQHQHQQRSPAAVALFVHGHAHDGAERHYHPSTDDSVVAQEAAALDEALDAATSALSVAFALLACAAVLRVLGGAARVWRPTPAWAWLTVHLAPALKPPRLS